MIESKEKAKFTPTDEQNAIINATREGRASIMATAYAGCAKSTTLALAAREVKVPALGVMFNKRNADEAKGKLPQNWAVKTANSLGLGAWLKANPSVNLQAPDGRKLGKLVSKIAKERGMELDVDQWEDARKLVESAMMAGLTPGDQGRPFIKNTHDAWFDLSRGLLMLPEDFHFLYELCQDVLANSVELGRQGIMSFDDQVYLPTVLGGRFPKFPFIAVDEGQDLNSLNHAMIGQTLHPMGRLFVVGDPKQCHPPGTMVELSGGGQKRIEELRIGDKLISYNRKVGFTGTVNQGVKVIANNCFHFEGNLVRITTEGVMDSHDCTPNHKCHVRWLDKKKCWLLYIMRKGNQYRMGIAQNWYNKPVEGFGPSMRARSEKADAMWVLEAYDSKETAMIQEKVLWTKFGLPDLIFRCSGKCSSTQAHLDAAWREIGDNSARGIACLKYFGRDARFPLYERNTGKHIGEKTFITQACNIVNGCMAVKVYSPEDENHRWETVWTEQVPYIGPVFGIEVGSNGYGLNLYVANRIVTHNSIYQFRGAHEDSMGQMAALRQNWAHLPLATTFRCPKRVVARHQTHAPGFRAHETNAEGRVERFQTLDDLGNGGWGPRELLGMVGPGQSIMVLCRNNGPLLSLAFKLLRQGVSVTMLGRDIGKGLIALSRKITKEDEIPRDTVAGLVNEWKDSEVSLALANDMEEKVSSITDKAECLQAVLGAAGVKDAGGLRAALTRLFSQETGRIALGSIHRAKGLEADVVVHLDPWRIPSKYAQEAVLLGNKGPLEQERNLLYVCETRTRNVLISANLEDFHAE